MKKFCITFLLSGIIILSGIYFLPRLTENKNIQTEYFRIHIRADSNDEKAQEVKYYVRDKLVEYLTPIIVNANSKKEAISLIEAHLFEIENVADDVLESRGFSYRASASLSQEEFPTRIYGNYTLEEGIYDALILNLGSGKGDNWWCVLYPPLCFSGEEGGNVHYKSIIKEKIDEWKKHR